MESLRQLPLALIRDPLLRSTLCRQILKRTQRLDSGRGFGLNPFRLNGRVAFLH